MDHDLEVRRPAGALAHGHGGPEDGARLHLVDLGMEQDEPHAPRAEHRVALLERAHALELVLELAQLRRFAQARLGDPLHELVAIGQELVQRGVQQPDRDRKPRHRLEEPSKSACWGGSSSSSAARRPASSSAMTMRCILGDGVYRRVAEHARALDAA
jgi:hypothetical protein